MTADRPVQQLQIGDADVFQSVFGWPDRTIDRLRIYEAALQQWQKAVNLVASGTLHEVWHRHFADSAQIARLIPQNANHIADLGAGGGFPGLVLAARFADMPGPRVTLVEADQRKAAFLRDAARRMEISVEILSTRIETDATVTRLAGVDTLTARAFAPLSRLFELAAPLFAPETVGVFLKGERLDQEIQNARVHWSFDVDLHRSLTEDAGRIAVVRRVKAKTEA